MSHTISICAEEDVSKINSSLIAYNGSQVPAILDFLWKPLHFAIYDENKTLLAGILGGVGGWGGLEISILWVREDLRGEGLGSQLLEHMETEGKKLGAWKARLDTFDFQARDFYLKKGYEICGTLKDFPKGHELYYFFKDL